MAALPKMLEEDRRWSGWSVAQVAWELGVSIREYRELEAGARPADTLMRISDESEPHGCC